VETHFLRFTVECHFEDIKREVAAISLIIELDSPGYAFKLHLQYQHMAQFRGQVNEKYNFTFLSLYSFLDRLHGL